MTTLEYPPFPNLKCNDGEWECEVNFPHWSGFQSRKGPYGGLDKESPADGLVNLSIEYDEDTQSEPSEYQVNAYQYHLNHGNQIVQSFLNGLLKYYSELKADWVTFIKPSDLSDVMPDITDINEFKNLIGISSIIIHPYFLDDQSYVGIIFGCTWDEEHSLGVMLHKDNVISIGGAEEAFAWAPDEAEFINA